MYVHPACISAWGGLYTIQAVAFDLLIAFSLLFPPHTRLPLYHHSSCNKIDLEEVVVGTYVPRVDPKIRRELSRRFFQFMVP